MPRQTLEAAPFRREFRSDSAAGIPLGPWASGEMPAGATHAYDSGPDSTRRPLLPASPWKWTLALALATAILVIAKPYVAGKPKNDVFALTATDRKGRMEIHWDASIPAVKTAQSGVLDVLDGNEIRRYPVDAKVLRSGALDYLRNAEDATVSLILLRDGQQVAQAAIRSVGPLAAAPEPPSVTTSHARRRR